jgi:hypothetical protein
LHLVEDQERAGFIAEVAHPLQADIGQRPDPALALDRLDEDRGGGIGDGVLKGGVVAEFAIMNFYFLMEKR